MDAAAEWRSSTEMLDGMRALVQSCEWTVENGRELGPNMWVAACVGPEVTCVEGGCVHSMRRP